jgi:predicted nucleotidyltransferase
MERSRDGKTFKPDRFLGIYMKISPTPHPDVNEILDFLLTNIRSILQDQFVGMCLFGSLANGDFDQHSDIDVLIVTEGKISDETFSSLESMHMNLAKVDSPWAIQQEVSYIPRDALRRFDPSNNLHPHLDRGNEEVLHWMAHESDWIIQRYILRERGVIITGPDLRSLIDPISRDELRQAVVNVLPLWTYPILDDPHRIDTRGYQSYCVLSLCRMLYTLQNKAILSKPNAAKWALHTLDDRWKPLIERAILGRQNSDMQADIADIYETLEMMRFVLGVSKQPTIFPDVNELLHLLLTNVKEILGDQFVGMYLYGSLSSGDFNPASSDIDFLVVTKDILPEETISKLEAMHTQTWATSAKRAGELEGSYVHMDLIRRHDPNGAPCPTVNEGKFYLDQRGSDWIIQRHVVREYGVIIEGPDPKTLIDPVTPEEIRGSIMGVLQEWWFPMLNDASWLRDHDDHYRAFAVITMCRVIHALDTGMITSKPKAVQFARTKLNSQWQSLIDKSVAASNHEDVAIPLDETLDLIRYIKEQVGELNDAKSPS